MNKKRVLIVTDYFVPHWTGIVTSLTYLIEQYSDIYEFEILTVNHTNKLQKNEKVGNACVTRVPYQLSISRAKISFGLLPQYIQMIQKTDIVFINSPHTAILFLALLARFFRKRVVVFHQADLILPKGNLNWLIEKLYDIQTHSACALSHAVATYTEDYARHSRILSHHLKKLVTFLLIPRNIKSLPSLLPEIIVQKKKKKTLFGFAGRYVEEKGIDILMRAIRRVVEKTTNVHFFFAGGVTHYEKHDYFAEFADVKRYVTNLGLLSSSSMDTFMKNIDALILPSRSECFGLVQIEAFLAGTPVIVSDIPGARFPVHSTKYGYMFESENDEELAKKIILFIRQKSSLSQYKNNVYPLLTQSSYDSQIRAFIG